LEASTLIGRIIYYNITDHVLTKETKNSFKLFDDVFQYFQLAGLSSDERQADNKNQEFF
jgi:hypothetical protein